MKTNCPLCDREADVYIKDEIVKYKKYVCEKCKMFVVTGDAEELLKTKYKQFTGEIQKLSASCCESPDNILLYIFSEVTQTGFELKTKVEPRSNWYIFAS